MTPASDLLISIRLRSLQIVDGTSSGALACQPDNEEPFTCGPVRKRGDQFLPLVGRSVVGNLIEGKTQAWNNLTAAHRAEALEILSMEIDGG